MVSELRIYFEGDVRLRSGFRKFLFEIAEVARSRRCHLDVIAADGTPVQDFRDALRTHPNAWNVLLLDSDSEFKGSHEDLCRSKGLDPTLRQSIFWMVQVMESWFLADLDAFKECFDRFDRAALKGNPKVEEIPKRDVLERLKKATNGKYHKVTHGTKLLSLIDPSKVREAAPNCDRMFRLILAELS